MSDRPLPLTVTAGLTTKADQIRALARAGYMRTEIAVQLEIRYQHVRQVLERSGIDLGRQRERVSAGLRIMTTGDSVGPATPPERIPATRLLEAGFVRLGEWTSTTDDAFELDCIAPTDAGVYAFVVDGFIRYIGLTQRGLRTRMGHYVRGHVRQRTSARVKGLILDALRSGSRTEVLIATPPSLEWNGLPINTAAGLEAGLIRMLRPEWNKRGTGA